jgi:hypothetical protein
VKSLKLSDRYRTPPMPFGLNVDDAVALADTIPGVHAARDIPHIPGRGVFKWLAWSPLDRIGPIRRGRPGLTVLDFAPARAAGGGR